MNEGYLPLYRKYRPQKLDDIVGQAHIKRALTNAIELNKISHAYLFTGPRGTGKTSTARILAKSLNCINGPTVNPCEECESCKAITDTVPIDVIEMDAASNRSVDDAREILEKINYAPIHGKYKIYIIDEVHMLSTEAFNTLLKTLEEPPKNVIFILATTEAHKVLDTIKSRCQRFDFKRITTADIVDHLKKIAALENIKISDEAITVIAKSSAGGMRDSLALLDQVSTIGVSHEISVDDINNMLGRLSFDILFEMATHIANSDSSSAICLLEKIYNDGNEPIQILNNLLLFFKNILVLMTCDIDTSIELTGLQKEQISSLETLKASFEKHQIVFLINKIADYIKELKETTNQQMWLEVALIDLSNLAANTRLIDLESRLARLENSNVESPSRNNISLPIKNVGNNDVEKTVTEYKEQDKVTVVENNVIKDKTNLKADETVLDSVEEVNVVSNNIGNISDLNATWLKILNEIPMSDGGGYAKMKAMTQLVKCDDEGVVIAVKKPLKPAAFYLPEKKKILTSAICKVLGVESVNLLVRERLPEDGEIKKNIKPQTKKKSVVPTFTLVDDEISKESAYDDVIEKKDELSSDENTMYSDQKKMIIDLFDAKNIE